MTLNDVTNGKIEFATMPGDRGSLPILARRVVVTGPPEVLRLAGAGDVNVLTELAGLLNDPARAWAAEVVLASLTRHEEDIVNSFAGNPAQWNESVGKNAYARWHEWLRSRAGKLQWDPATHTFAESSGLP